MSLSYDNIPLAVQPLGIKVKLFKHQLSSIYKNGTFRARTTGL